MLSQHGQGWVPASSASRGCWAAPSPDKLVPSHHWVVWGQPPVELQSKAWAWMNAEMSLPPKPTKHAPICVPLPSCASLLQKNPVHGYPVHTSAHPERLVLRQYLLCCFVVLFFFISPAEITWLLKSHWNFSSTSLLQQQGHSDANGKLLWYLEL